jgi:TolB-like protein/class 3 adenylate cyclase/Tfp pilus assembly protein PilF
MTAIRRLAAIMAVDVVGYSRLMGEDEAGTAAAVRENFDAIRHLAADRGGRIVKTMGDGLLLEFSSIVDAVECAILIQKQSVVHNAGTPQAKRIVYRVGVNLGDVLVEGDDILGEGVNIAARLEGVCVPGDVLVSGSAFDQVRGKVAANFVDAGEQSLKNIALPVRAYALQVAGTGKPPALKASAAEKISRKAKPPDVLRSFRRTAILLFVIGILGWRYIASHPIPGLTAPTRTPVVATSPAATIAIAPSPTPAEPSHLSLVVLPFSNLSGDPTQDYFADAVTENLTTDLSRIPGSFVIARNTAFTYKGKAIDARQIGRELGVRYVLEGSVQRDGNRVRVNAELIDAETGAHRWADRFEDDVADIFKLQDEVVGRLANALKFQLVRAEAETAAHSGNPDVIDLVMRGKSALARFVQQPSKANNEAVKALFEQALAIDPNDPDALAGDAGAYLNEWGFGWVSPATDYDAKILGQTDRALARAPDNLRAYSAKGAYLTLSGRPGDGIRVLDAGLAVDPNDALLLAARSNAESYLGQFQQAKSDIGEAIRLSPRDPRLGQWHNFAADADIGLGAYDAAIDHANKAIDAGYKVFWAYLNLAAAQALKGNADEAESALAEALRLNPKLSVKWLTERKPTLQPAFDGLRKAGLPES